MQPTDTNYFLPIFGGSVAIAAAIPEAYFRRLFVSAIVAVPLLAILAAGIYIGTANGAVQGLVAATWAMLMIMGLWCLPVLLGAATGFIVRFALVMAKEHLSS
jgi:hypothetical protein